MAANKHLTHVEDAMITDGKQGAVEAIKALRQLGNFLIGDRSASMSVTEKFDGAPAVICGIDPQDGRFFVGTKSVFNKNDPKIAKSVEDIQRMYSGGVVPKLVDSFKYLSGAGIKGVMQGDLMFTNDKSSKTIDGKKFITFKPNTLTYAINPETPLGKQIAAAKLGIVFHTYYTGDDIQNMSASFTIPPNSWSESAKNVWIGKAEFTNITKASMFTASEEAKYKNAVNKAEGSMRQAGDIFNKIQSGKRTLAFDTEFLKFFNGYVKKGAAIPSVDRAYRDFHHHLGQEYNKIIKKYKNINTQAKKAGEFLDRIEFLEKNEHKVRMLIATYMNIIAAKMLAFNKMKQVSAMRVFVQMPNGDFKVTTPEGYVCSMSERVVKIIDRLEFSKLNFLLPKQW